MEDSNAPSRVRVFLVAIPGSLVMRPKESNKGLLRVLQALQGAHERGAKLGGQSLWGQ